MTASLENQHGDSFGRLPRTFDSGLLGKIRQFEGKKEEVKSFLAQLEVRFRLYQLTNEEKIMVFAQHLNVSAFNWYSSINCDNWDELKKRFISKYNPKSLPHEAFAKFMSIKQAKGELIEEYLGRFKEQKNELESDLPKEMICGHFLNSLILEIRDLVRIQLFKINNW